MSNTNTQIQRAIEVLNRAKTQYEREPTDANRERYIHVRSIFQRDPQIWEQIQREWQNPEIIEGGDPNNKSIRMVKDIPKSKKRNKGAVCDYGWQCKSGDCLQPDSLCK